MSNLNVLHLSVQATRGYHRPQVQTCLWRRSLPDWGMSRRRTERGRVGKSVKVQRTRTSTQKNGTPGVSDSDRSLLLHWSSRSISCEQLWTPGTGSPTELFAPETRLRLKSPPALHPPQDLDPEKTGNRGEYFHCDGPEGPCTYPPGPTSCPVGTRPGSFPLDPRPTSN